ncbi:RNA polymerase II transcriptional coactivator KELP-like, partial [Dioscorea cayenensis subsp. rotundata]|uniref:RNA polymerase II transcriptional coactivator KELP-like n=1 Tax=Dioscorea cayennensis subsp. rotundata TaxID=55577 RepID=A0AB40B1R6_DIOCR
MRGDEEMKKKISNVVLDILNTADMEKTTEFKVRSGDEEMKKKIPDVVLDILNTADIKKTIEFKVRTAAIEHLGIDLSHPDSKRFLSNKRMVTLPEFRGKTLVSIREYFEKNGKQFRPPK